MKFAILNNAAKAAIAAVLFSSAAHSQDGLDPFIETWSGVFTTQDHAFWSVEDFVCFPGCPAAARAHMVELLADPANDEIPAGALLGMAFAHGEQHLTTVLTPLGKQIQNANDIRNDPKLLCQPYGFVRQVTNPLPMMITRDGDHLLIEYEEWSLLRRIFMDDRAHPEFATPSTLGHSVGRIEDGALIVETARVTADWIADTTRGGHSDQLTAVERYTLHDDPRRLELELTLTDPVVLAEPYVILKTWLATPDVELLQDSCGEIPGRF